MTKYMTHHFLNIWNTFFNKDGLIWKCIVSAIMYFADIHFYLIAIFTLITIDLITGVWGSKVQGEQFTSRKLRKGLLEKTLLYSLLLIASFFLGKVFQEIIKFEQFYLAWILTIMITVYEITSIIENMIKINPRFAYLSKFYKFLGRLVNKQMGEDVDGKEKANAEQD